MKTTLTFACLAISLAIAPAARAVLIPFEATDNATVQVAGPRTGANGKNFFNIQGGVNPSFSSFGVADFNLATLPVLPGPLVGVSLQMTQSNAGFSLTGPLSVHLSDQTAVDIQPANTMLNYVSGMNGVASVDTDLLPLQSLGAGTYTVTSNGAVDTFPLSFTGGALASLQSALANGTTLRLIIAPEANNVAATYSGFSNATFAGPTLVFDVLPEPNSFVLVACGMAALAAARRRG